MAELRWTSSRTPSECNPVEGFSDANQDHPRSPRGDRVACGRGGRGTSSDPARRSLRRLDFGPRLRRPGGRRRGDADRPGAALGRGRRRIALPSNGDRDGEAPECGQRHRPLSRHRHEQPDGAGDRRDRRRTRMALRDEVGDLSIRRRRHRDPARAAPVHRASERDFLRIRDEPEPQCASRRVAPALRGLSDPDSAMGSDGRRPVARRRGERDLYVRSGNVAARVSDPPAQGPGH